MSEPQTTYYDKNNRPICGGDLLRSYHFTGARRKVHYLYHVAVPTDIGFECVPVSQLDPSKVKSGGRAWLSKDLASEMEIIHANTYPSFEDRIKKKKETDEHNEIMNSIINHDGVSI